jgi:Tol biopolymer transport system component
MSRTRPGHNRSHIRRNDDQDDNSRPNDAFLVGRKQITAAPVCRTPPRAREIRASSVPSLLAPWRRGVNARIGAGADPLGPGALGRLAFAIKDGSGVSNIYSVKPDGNRLIRLTNTSERDLCPDYSRDGRLITFCSSRSGPFQIWAMNADGSNVHMVTNGKGFFIFPDYSPDASKIVFSGTASDADVNDNDNDNDNDNVYVINADGTGFTQLTTDGNNDYPTFSPDGKKIAFISDRTGVEQSDWSPNGRKIAFEQGDIGSGRIWVMNADGSNPVQLTSGPGDDFGTAWSPDGQKIAFVRDFANGDRSV